MNQLASDTMKIQLASDLHLEFLQCEHPGERLITPAPDADVLVLAGDIANGTDAIRLFADWPVPVLYLAGNHEFYGLCMENTRRELRAASRGSNVRFLDEEAVELGGVRFLGATLWTDYDLDGRPAQAAIMRMCERRLMDHSAIRTRRGTFEAADAWQEHQSSRNWLQAKLSEPFAGATVVISHHGPHRNSVHPRYAGDPVNGGFVSDLTPLLAQASLWLHGHVHDSCAYRVGGCRVVVNPRGYVVSRNTALDRSQWQFENAAFEDACVIQLEERRA